MIRPFTCLTFLLACGSGLYLYQSKHQASLLDDQIAQTVKSTDALHEQTRMLSAEWTLLNDPERLRQLANQFLTLQTVSPNQFTSLADLDGRLPTPVAPGAPGNGGDTAPSGQATVPVASNDSSRTGAEEGNAADARPGDTRPAGAKIADAGSAASGPAVPGKDAPPPASRAASPSGASQPARVAAGTPGEASHSADGKPPMPRIASAAPASHPLASQVRPSDQREPEQRGPEQRGFEQRLAEARPMAATQRFASPAPLPQPGFQSGGSLLGMAHGMAAPPAPMPLPRPMPVSAPQWNYGGTGG